MQPNYPSPRPIGPQPDPYAFITNAPTNRKPSIFNNGSKKVRIFIVVGGLLLILILGIMFMTILGSGSKARNAQLIEIGQRQSEIIRLSSMATEKSNSLDTKNYALTIKLSMTSSQNDLNKIITSGGISQKELSKKLTQSKNAETDQILNEALKNNRFDETYKEVINNQLSNYQKQLNSVYTGSTKKQKASLKLAYDQATILVGPKK